MEKPARFPERYSTSNHSSISLWVLKSTAYNETLNLPSGPPSYIFAEKWSLILKICRFGQERFSFSTSTRSQMYFRSGGMFVHNPATHMLGFFSAPETIFFIVHRFEPPALLKTQWTRRFCFWDGVALIGTGDQDKQSAFGLHAYRFRVFTGCRSHNFFCFRSQFCFSVCTLRLNPCAVHYSPEPYQFLDFLIALNSIENSF